MEYREATREKTRAGGRTLLRLGVFVCLAVASTKAHATPESTPAPAAKKSAEESAAARAAAEFELGVNHYAEARYEAAARAFLRADQLAPSADALTNALTAARKAGAHLLVASVAGRILDRETSDPGSLADARAALAEAARHLAHVRVSCAPKPCRLLLDGARMEEGSRFVTPGSHRFLAEFEEGARREVVGTLQAGTAYDFTLDPPTEGAPPPRVQPERGANDGTSSSEIVFYAGLGTTLALAGITTWSGIDALSFHDAIGDNPTEAERLEHGSKTARTDILLGASIGAGVLTLAWALFGVEWGREAPPPLEASFGPQGAFLSARGVLP